MIIPAAAGAYAYVRLVAYFLGFLASDRTWCPLLGDAFGPFVLVLAGAMMAPRRRFLTGVVLVIVHWILLNALKPELGLLHSDWLNNASRLLSIAGTLLAVYCVYVAQVANVVKQQQPLPLPEPHRSSQSTRRMRPSTVKLAPVTLNDEQWHATTIFLRK
jgi:hypothetical protein